MTEGSWVQQTTWGIVVYVLRQVAGELSNHVWGWFSGFFATPISVPTDPLVQQLVQIGIALAMGFLPVAVGWTVMKETFARMDGSSTTPPESLVRRILLAGAGVTGTSLVAWYMASLADHGRAVLQGAGFHFARLEPFFKLHTDLGLTPALLTTFFLVCALILLVQRAIITAEFTVLVVMGPFMAAGLIREGGQTTWNIWLREIISVLLTPLIQMLVILIFLQKWAGTSMLDLQDRLFALAFLWVLWNTPRWARQMVYQVGAGHAMVGGAVSVGRIAVMKQLMRVK